MYEMGGKWLLSGIEARYGLLFEAVSNAGGQDGVKYGTVN